MERLFQAACGCSRLGSSKLEIGIEVTGMSRSHEARIQKILKQMLALVIALKTNELGRMQKHEQREECASKQGCRIIERAPVLGVDAAGQHGVVGHDVRSQLLRPHLQQQPLGAANIASAHVRLAVDTRAAKNKR